MTNPKYITATGKRKRAIARIYLEKGEGKIEVNGTEYKTYFPEMYLQNQVELPLKVVEAQTKFDIKVNVSGGGLKGQAEALRLGISRALVQVDSDFKPALRALDLMTRDPRVVERKKFGQKKARKQFQFTKR